jgi:hypothetical protein
VPIGCDTSARAASLTRSPTMAQYGGLFPIFVPMSATDRELEKFLKKLISFRKRLSRLSIHDAIKELVTLNHRALNDVRSNIDLNPRCPARVISNNLDIIPKAFDQRWFDKDERQPQYEWHLVAEKAELVLAELKGAHDSNRPDFERLSHEGVPGREYSSCLHLYLSICDQLWMIITSISMRPDPRLRPEASTRADEARDRPDQADPAPVEP